VIEPVCRADPREVSF